MKSDEQIISGPGEEPSYNDLGRTALSYSALVTRGSTLGKITDAGPLSRAVRPVRKIRLSNQALTNS